MRKPPHETQEHYHYVRPFALTKPFKTRLQADKTHKKTLKKYTQTDRSKIASTPFKALARDAAEIADIFKLIETLSY